MSRKQETAWAESQAERMTCTGGEREGTQEGSEHLSSLSVFQVLSPSTAGGPEAEAGMGALALSESPLLALGLFPDDRHRLSETAVAGTVAFSLRIPSLTLLTALGIRKPQETLALDFSWEKLSTKTTPNFYREFAVR